LTAVCASALLLTGCASSSDLAKLRADVAHAQQTADQALQAANAAQASANSANQKADQALSAANQANQTANDTNQRLDRMFKNSMMK
jgi:uncharacterized lipoprotein YajG